jgi:hypothetical protein
LRRALTTEPSAALIVIAVSIASAVGSLVVGRESGIVLFDSISLNLGLLSFGVLGALLIFTGGSRTIGWLFLAIAFLGPTGDLALQVAQDHYARPAPGAVAGVSAWYLEWHWIPLVFLQIVVIPMVFPTGRPMQGLWRRVFLVIVSLLTLFTVLAALDAKLDVNGRIVGDNAIGISPFGDLENGSLQNFFWPFFLVSAFLGALALVVRFRRSRGEERQQLKWVVFTGTAVVISFFGVAVVDTIVGYRPAFLDSMVLALLPIGIGTAILRYRLYDIDVIINRTIVYGSLTAFLVTSYLGLVVALQFALEPLTNDSDLAVAASTLAVAAFFRPLRARVQTFIDRRFYRRKYDATRTLTTFGMRLRDEVDLDVVASDVVGVVKSTVQPAHVSLWVRKEMPS